MNKSFPASIVSRIRLVFSVAAALLLGGTASAVVIQGNVSCTDNTPATPLPNVTVIATGMAGDLSGVTDSNGNYSISFTLMAPDLYQVHLTNLPAGLTYVDPSDGTHEVFVLPGDNIPHVANFVLTGCAASPLGEIGGWVWNDLNCDGIWDDLYETGLPDVVVGLINCDNWMMLTNTWTDADGFYRFTELPASNYLVQFVAPPGYEFSPAGADSDADPVTGATICFPLGAGETNLTWDAGLCRLEAPGVRSQGYWKNHPDEWPVEQIEIGGVIYDKAEAIRLMQLPTKGDKWANMFEQLVAAKLNVLAGNESDCIEGTIAFADMWMQVYPPPVTANSAAWKQGGASLHGELDDYNNGFLCAPSAGE